MFCWSWNRQLPPTRASHVLMRLEFVTIEAFWPTRDPLWQFQIPQFLTFWARKTRGHKLPAQKLGPNE